MVKLRAPFSKFPIPAIVYAIAIDALDLLPNLIEFAASLTGIGILAALATNLAMDAVQGVIAFFVFDSILIWGASTVAEGFFPAPIDVLPTYTAMFLAIERGLIK